MTHAEIASKFALRGLVREVRPLGQGFINDTLFVFIEGEEQPAYILQSKNSAVFPDIPGMMDNIVRVTAYIRSQCPEDPDRCTLTVIPTREGAWWLRDEEGRWWTMCVFIRGSKCYERADTPQLCYDGGAGLGRFHQLVGGFKEPLAEVLPGFHNMRFRFEQWDASVAADKAGRVAAVREDIAWIEAHRQEMLDYWGLYESGVLPGRVTHNDTKLSNFLFDAQTGKLLCAIDLDTMMTRPLMCDVGDALRSYTNTGAEDEKDPSKVSMSLELYTAWMKGYLSCMAGSLTAEERDTLAFSGLYITYEQVLRFLMDYLDGDTYYKTAYAEHNLVRARAQKALFESMQAQYGQMCRVVAEF